MNNNVSTLRTFFLVTLVSALIAGCTTMRKVMGTDEKQYVVATSTSSAFIDGKNPAISDGAKTDFKPFYVYTDERSKENHYAPSGWMGDVKDLKFSGALQKNPRLGTTCLKITYLSRGTGGWAGIYWQNPANNWGSRPGGFDLRGAKALTFWARGERGGERLAEVKIGGISGKYADSDVAWIGPVRLKKEWQQYRIDLTDKDLRNICGGFCFTILRTDNPAGCTFYLDEIRYE